MMRILLNRIIKQLACIRSWMNNKQTAAQRFPAAFIVEEFFHEDLRGFGGFGSTVKNITDFYNSNGHPYKFHVALTQKRLQDRRPSIQSYHQTQVLLAAQDMESPLSAYQYMDKLNSLGPKIFISIDYYPSYELPLAAAPNTPLLIWIRDPRGREEWMRLASIKMELQQRHKKDAQDLTKIANGRSASLKKVIQHSQVSKRKIIFASNASFLTVRARKAYELDSLNPYILSNPIPLPEFKGVQCSAKPSLCFIGRLDAAKRFWIVCELAKRFKDVDFFIAGKPHYPELTGPVIDKYRDVPNLKFLGTTTGEGKEKLLQNCWGLINSSIHEGYPVTFQEAFAYGKPVISCVNPEGLAEKFGYFTGDILGEGLDEGSLNLFAEQIRNFLSDENLRKEKGIQARRYVELNHSFENFDRQLNDILRKEGLKK